ncbi:unnamed protein product, partial [Laminaria digitata]
VTPDGPASTQHFGYAERPGAGGRESADATLEDVTRSSAARFRSTRTRGKGGAAAAAEADSAVDAARGPARAPERGVDGVDAAARELDARWAKQYHATARWRAGRASAVQAQEGAGARRGKPHPRGRERHSDAALDVKPWLASSSPSGGREKHGSDAALDLDAKPWLTSSSNASAERRTVPGEKKPYDPIAFREDYRGGEAGPRRGFETEWATAAFESVAGGTRLRSSSSSHGAYRRKTFESALYGSALDRGVDPYLSGASTGSGCAPGGSKSPREEERLRRRSGSGSSSTSTARYHSRIHMREERGAAVVADDGSESGRVREAIDNMSLVSGRRGQRSDWKSAYTASAAAPAPVTALAPAPASASTRPRPSPAAGIGMPEISRYASLPRRPVSGLDLESDTKAEAATDPVRSSFSPSRPQREAAGRGGGTGGGGWAMGGSSLSAKRWTAADAPSLVRPAAALAGAGERGSSSSSLSRHREESSDFSLHRPSPNAEILRSARREASSRRLNARSSTAGDVLGRLAVNDDGAGVEAEVGAGAGSFFGSARRRSLRRGYSYGGDEDTVAKQDSVSVAHRRQAVATAAAAANREADWREAELGQLRSSTPRGRTSTFTSTSTSMSTSPPLP